MNFFVGKWPRTRGNIEALHESLFSTVANSWWPHIAGSKMNAIYCIHWLWRNRLNLLIITFSSFTASIFIALGITVLNYKCKFSKSRQQYETFSLGKISFTHGSLRFYILNNETTKRPNTTIHQGSTDRHSEPIQRAHVSG